MNQTLTPQRSPVKTPQTETISQAVLSQAEALFHTGEYQRAIQTAKQIVQQYPQSFETHYLLAQTWANLGDYEQVVHCCQQAIQVNDMSEKPYYILAQIAEEKGDIEQAKSLPKKNYLSFSFVSRCLSRT